MNRFGIARGARVAAWALLASWLLFPAPDAASQEADPRNVTFDVFAFSQDDDGGQALRAEGFRYGGARATAALPVSPRTTLELELSVSLIDNDVMLALPSTIGSADVTSASPNVLTLDARLGWHVHEPGSVWTLRPSIYYHHQTRFLGGGPDLAVSGALFGGDAVVTGSLGLRFSAIDLDYWDGTDRGDDTALSVNALLSWTQNLSPSWLAGSTLQLVRQVGFLGDGYNYVVLEPDGVPSRLTDEVLPRARARFQLGARIRYSPSRGSSLGADGSYYDDDWGIRLVTFEPRVTLPFRDARAELWYRVSKQDGSKYFERHPSRETRFRTQDSDLGTFVTQGGGTALEVPVDRILGPGSESRLALFGFHRNDGISGIGGHAGVVLRW